MSEDNSKNLSSRIKKCCNCNEALFTKNQIKFCNRSCAAKFNNSQRKHTEETKIKITKSLLKNGKKLCYYNYCSICDIMIKNSKRTTCSKECFSKKLTKAGLSSAKSQKDTRRSKDEIELFNLCLSEFKNVDHNQQIANGWDADILLPDHKIAILWNGPWHYKEMNMTNHSLKQVQNRDSIKIKEFKKIGWEVLVYEDKTYTPKTAFSHLKEYIKMSIEKI